MKIEATLIDAAISFFSFLASAEPFSTRHTPDTATLVGVRTTVVAILEYQSVPPSTFAARHHPALVRERPTTVDHTNLFETLL